jgi:geranylgeranyl diphosphate synthase type I
MLVHDDIIDKSRIRRGEPSMHEVFKRRLIRRKKVKFTGEDLAIVAGDIMFAMAINSLLSVREKAEHKEKALRKLAEAAFYTGGGEFFELICGLKTIDEITKEDIFKIYDLKTANYTFSSPLTIGASLAGAKDTEINKLFEYGIKLGRAFQIKDDILGMFGSEKEIGKSVLTDLQEAKKTILIWYAYNHSAVQNRLTIKKIFEKHRVIDSDLFKMRRIVSASGAYSYAKKEINSLVAEAKALGVSLKMHKPYKDALYNYSENLLAL